jgi:hypothetical protein
MSMNDPVGQSEIETLQAELRSAVQHRNAAYEQMQETQRAVHEVVLRAQALLAKVRATDQPLRR